MMRLCSPADGFTGMWPGDIPRNPNGSGRIHCGMVFDDVERSTICPHPTICPEFPSWFELLMWCVGGSVFVNDFMAENYSDLLTSTEEPGIRLSGFTS